MISYRRADIIDRINDPYISDVAKDVFRYWISYVNSQGPSEDPNWDSSQCRCENNGDYCEYCEEISQQQSERVNTMSKPVIWQELNKQVVAGSFLNYLRMHDKVIYQKVVDAIDNPALKPLLERVIFDTPIEVEASLLSYRHADLINRIQEMAEPIEIRWELDRSGNGTRFGGGSIENLEENLKGNVLTMMQGMEAHVHSMPGYIERGSIGLISSSFPEIVAGSCAEFASKQPGFYTRRIEHNHSTGDCVLLVWVKQ